MTATPVPSIHDGLFNYFCEFDAEALIGTHSRIIEGHLFAHSLAQGGRIEMERPTIASLFGGKPEIRIDGVQMWANPALI
ncbi:MAG: hypothetical protein ABIR04_08810 [Cypionkella sp.]